MPDNYAASRFIDLHSHTTESDGSYTPEELVDLAVRNGLQALAITDHDTFAGYRQAIPFAEAAGLTLVQGIELNSRVNVQNSSDSRSAHILGYFPDHEPSGRFLLWLQSEQDERRERNRKLAGALQQQGIKILLSEVEARGKTLAGRTHFAQLLVEKQYVGSFEEAFQRYLGRGASAYIERESQSTEEIIGKIRDAGGIPTVAHPIRLSLPKDVERRALARLKDAGLIGLEVCHSDQSAEMQAYYAELAEELQLVPTGGSDFHGTAKPSIELGRGYKNNVSVPYSVLERLQRTTLKSMVSAG